MKATFFRIFSGIILAFAFAAASSAQNYEAPEVPKFDFYTRGAYRAEVPRPQAVLRYDVGDFHTTYAQMEKVIEDDCQSRARPREDFRHRRNQRTSNAASRRHLVAGKYRAARRNQGKQRAPDRFAHDYRRPKQTQITQNNPVDRVDGLHDSRQRIGFV